MPSRYNRLACGLLLGFVLSACGGSSRSKLSQRLSRKLSQPPCLKQPIQRQPLATKPTT
ncbi:hypothetical protein [Herpetosiphon sp.]|uniref:hypothetical protein n=1 Tax=Herpetosiphon sp. TaxID=71864 RepID=UPI0003126FA8|nr:hypothetical protein [Herpetosiphon sp.]